MLYIEIFNAIKVCRLFGKSGMILKKDIKIGVNLISRLQFITIDEFQTRI